MASLINRDVQIPLNTGIAGMAVLHRCEMGFVAWVVARARASFLGNTSGRLPENRREFEKLVSAEVGVCTARAKAMVEQAIWAGFLDFAQTPTDPQSYGNWTGQTHICSATAVTKALINRTEDEKAQLRAEVAASPGITYYDPCSARYKAPKKNIIHPSAFTINLLRVIRPASVYLHRKVSKIRAILVNAYQLAGSISQIAREVTAAHLRYSRRFVIKCSEREPEFVVKETGIAFNTSFFFANNKISSYELNGALIAAEMKARRNGVDLPGRGQLLRPVYYKEKNTFDCAIQIGNRYGYSDNTIVKPAGWLAHHAYPRRPVAPPNRTTPQAKCVNTTGSSQLAFSTIPKRHTSYVQNFISKIVADQEGSLQFFTDYDNYSNPPLDITRLGLYLITLNSGTAALPRHFPRNKKNQPTIRHINPS